MIAVAGVTNLETSLAIESFPLAYSKSRFAFHGVRDRIGGVGHNVAAAAAHLGIPVRFLTMLGNDLLADGIEARLRATPGLDTRGVLRLLPQSLRSVILVDAQGAASIHTDLKESQEMQYPAERAAELLGGTKLFHATNINWSLPLAEEARRRGCTISTDVQAIRSLDGDAYNARFLRVADIVFLSAENLTAPVHDVIRQLWDDFDVNLVVVGQGAGGATLGERAANTLLHLPAVSIRPVRNTTGGGDALAGAFLASLAAGFSPRECLLRAQIFAGYKIGEPGDASGFPPLDVLDTAFEARRSPSASLEPR